MTVISAQGIFFDEDNHEYTTLTNERLASNTEILEALGFSDYSKVPERLRMISLEIGTDVHKATAFLDRRKPWKEGYSHVAGYVEGWQKFKKEFKFRPKIIEEPLFDPGSRVATTPDRYGPSIHNDITVQIKTGKAEDWVGLQLAFEELCIRHYLKLPTSPISTDRRFAIWLRPDGTYKPRRFTDPMDVRTYLSAISVHQWLKNHNRLKGGNSHDNSTAAFR